MVKMALESVLGIRTRKFSTVLRVKKGFDDFGGKVL